MNLPVLCERCGTTYQSGLILPATSSMLAVPPDKLIPRDFAGSTQKCPVCQTPAAPEALKLSHSVLYELRTDSPTSAELRELIAALRLLVADRAQRAQVEEAIEQRAPKFTGVITVMPDRTANLLAYLTLVVALATLVENALGDLPDLIGLVKKAAQPRRRGPAPSPKRATPTEPVRKFKPAGRPVLVEEFGGGALTSDSWAISDTDTWVPDAVAVRWGELQVTGQSRLMGRVGGGIYSTIHQAWGQWCVRFRVSEGAGYVAHVNVQTVGKDPRYFFGLRVNLPTTSVASVYVEDTGKQQTVVARPLADFTKWHVLAIDITPAQIRFYLDDEELSATKLESDWAVPPKPLRLDLNLSPTSIDPKDIKLFQRTRLHVDQVKIYRHRE